MASGLTLDQINSVEQAELVCPPGFQASAKPTQAQLRAIEKLFRVKIRAIGKNKLQIRANEEVEVGQREAQEKIAQASAQIKLRLFGEAQTANTKKPRPAMTHFISIPLTGEPIKRNLKQFYDSVLSLPDLKKRNITEALFQKLEKFHLTICPLRLDTEQKQREAGELLRACVEELVKPLLARKADALTVRIRALDIMNDDFESVRVLFARVASPSPQDSDLPLQELANQIQKRFADQNLMHTSDWQNGDLPVKLHATLMKTSNRKSKKPLKPFDASEIFEKYKNFEFADCLRLSQLHLSSLTELNEAGYYKELAAFSF